MHAWAAAARDQDDSVTLSEWRKRHRVRRCEAREAEPGEQCECSERLHRYPPIARDFEV